MEHSVESEYGLKNHGFYNLGRIYWNLVTPALYEQVVRFREGIIAHLGPIVVRTGDHTGRSPRDKFTVREPSSEEHIWWGDINRPFAPEQYENLKKRMMAYFQGRSVFVQDCHAGADPRYQVPIRIVTEAAWHSLFARNMFIRAERETLRKHVPAFTIIDAPNFHAVPEMDGTNSQTFILVNFGAKEVLIGGTAYAGEIKKSVFTILNYILPQECVLSMHCSANYGPSGDVALFFGLSGTGKTTLSADPTRTLIGDDEHGWSDTGVFNFEGGCYAKVIRLSRTGEPEIYETTRRFGTILENVAIGASSRRIDLNDDNFTENTRAAYPITHIPNADRNGWIDAHPRNIIMLTADAFGVMPPIARLTPEQGQYHFLLGYTAKVAGTERGMGSEPSATFSPCFGAPFMALHPSVYGEMLAARIMEHNVDAWLVNTGWTGGPYGVGHRMELGHTRAMIHAALDGSLADVETRVDPYFGLNVPVRCPGVPDAVLDPRGTWDDPEAYDAKARELRAQFDETFRPFEAFVSNKVARSCPFAEEA
ncbi:MAG: phosphoenolpyruvate carboxykinase (ATP) [Anaerolineae bacterium]|nr:phosphoenolpyruvate carboxykinase (ATP) [Anaerolineae bacterium]